MEFHIWEKLLNASEVMVTMVMATPSKDMSINFIGKSFANDHVVCSLLDSISFHFIFLHLYLVGFVWVFTVYTPRYNIDR